jgi:hypothetical protein
MSDRSEKDNQDLIKELTKRVLALDSKRRSSDDDTVRYSIDALAEITKIDTAEIEKIAKEIIAEQEQRLAGKHRTKNLVTTHGRELIAYLTAGIFAVITLFALTALWHSSTQEANVSSPTVGLSAGTQEANVSSSTAESSAGGELSQATNRHLYIRSKLGDALLKLAALKLLVEEYYAAVGKLPTTMTETGFDFREFEKLDGIEKVFLTKESGIGASLSMEFGDAKWVILQPTLSSGGVFISWVCNTNIEQKYLGPPKAAICLNTPSMPPSAH